MPWHRAQCETASSLVSTPSDPTLQPRDAAVWRFRADAIRPLETVLAKYLGLEPNSLRLGRSREGKPELQGSPFCASLAHSGDVALVAVSHGWDIGVDLEVLRERIETWSLVRHALTADERARLQALPASQRSAAFLEVWTRKEALLKAAGVGLSVDPQLIELDGATVLSVPPALGEPSDWTLADLPVPGYAAALAIFGRPARVLFHDARASDGGWPAN